MRYPWSLLLLLLLAQPLVNYSHACSDAEWAEGQALVEEFDAAYKDAISRYKSFCIWNESDMSRQRLCKMLIDRDDRFPNEEVNMNAMLALFKKTEAHWLMLSQSCSRSYRGDAYEKYNKMHEFGATVLYGEQGIESRYRQCEEQIYQSYIKRCR
ncbi:MAG: hypothetical protein HQL49_01985 [Gammaproteobacteria bacterium]|nr:hypothetical protein [Gammaproteobacteria bacterium]